MTSIRLAIFVLIFKQTRMSKVKKNLGKNVAEECKQVFLRHRKAFFLSYSKAKLPPSFSGMVYSKTSRGLLPIQKRGMWQQRESRLDLA